MQGVWDSEKGTSILEVFFRSFREYTLLSLFEPTKSLGKGCRRIIIKGENQKGIGTVRLERRI